MVYTPKAAPVPDVPLCCVCLQDALLPEVHALCHSWTPQMNRPHASLGKGQQFMEHPAGSCRAWTGLSVVGRICRT
jgi:hypothetical protein